jgi:hypothetical protein
MDWNGRGGGGKRGGSSVKKRRKKPGNWMAVLESVAQGLVLTPSLKQRQRVSELVPHRLCRPARDETGIPRFGLVLLSLQFFSLLGHDAYPALSVAEGCRKRLKIERWLYRLRKDSLKSIAEDTRPREHNRKGRGNAKFTALRGPIKGSKHPPPPHPQIGKISA